MSYTSMSKALNEISWKTLSGLWKEPAVTGLGKAMENFSYVLSKFSSQLFAKSMPAFPTQPSMQEAINLVSMQTVDSHFIYPQLSKTCDQANDCVQYSCVDDSCNGNTGCVTRGSMKCNLQWYIDFYNQTISELSVASNVPSQFVFSYPQCLIKNCLEPYSQKIIGTVKSWDFCSISRLLPTYKLQELDIFKVTVAAAESDFFNYQSGLFDFMNPNTPIVSSEIANQCYQKNLNQGVNTGEDFIKYFNETLSASGTFSMQYLSEYCVGQWVQQNFTIVLPTANMPNNSSLFYNEFLTNYYSCSINALINTYQQFQQQWMYSNCNQELTTNLNNTAIYPLGSAGDGSLSLYSSAGFLSTQLHPNSKLNDTVQNCFNQSLSTFNEQEKKVEDAKNQHEQEAKNAKNKKIKRIFILFAVVGGISIIGVSFVLIKRRKKHLEKNLLDSNETEKLLEANENS